MGLFRKSKKEKLGKSGYNAIPKKYRKLIDISLNTKKRLEHKSDEELFSEIIEDDFKNKSREEIFGYISEVSGRVLGMSHYPVQMMGAMIQTDGDVAEMKTGEGKTLTSTLAIIYKALMGETVYVITTNEYLSERDAKELEPLYNKFGLTVGINKADIPPILKKSIYKADIIYTTNSELVFDYLRDNMVMFVSDKVNHNGLDYALIDEVDSILIDDAKTPLIISGQQEVDLSNYLLVNTFVKNLNKNDYTIDMAVKTVELTESGIDKAEETFNKENLYHVENMPLLSIIRMVLKAHYTYTKGIEYNVVNGEVVLINQSTGRLLPSSKYSDGLHQAIEVKEGVQITPIAKTIANITYQDFFRQFKTLSGMTGTGLTEAEEFLEIYNMRVIPVPTNKPKLRIDHNDIIFMTVEDKLNELLRYVKEENERGRPILIGTASVETSEIISEKFKKNGIKHEVLNAKNHEREAEIVANAGQLGAVTVATNMAGRGTDIKLSQKSKDLGGLVVIGTERHESRRIDNQLRGRSGRQGDPGESYFIISLEDRILKEKLPESLIRTLNRTNLLKGQSIDSKMITNSIESAQKRVEGNHYDSRKNVLKYGSVLNTQRALIYKDREDVLVNGLAEDLLEPMMEDYLKTLVYLNEDRDRYELLTDKTKGLNMIEKNVINLDGLVDAIENEYLTDYTKNILNTIKETIGESRYNSLIQLLILKHLDKGWTDHLSIMEELLTGISLRSQAQKDPLREYQNDGAKLFNDMLEEVSIAVAQEVLNIELTSQENNVQTFKFDGADEKDKEIMLNGGLTINDLSIQENVLSLNPELIESNNISNIVFKHTSSDDGEGGVIEEHKDFNTTIGMNINNSKLEITGNDLTNDELQAIINHVVNKNRG